MTTIRKAAKNSILPWRFSCAKICPVPLTSTFILPYLHTSVSQKIARFEQQQQVTILERNRCHHVLLLQQHTRVRRWESIFVFVPLPPEQHVANAVSTIEIQPTTNQIKYPLRFEPFLLPIPMPSKWFVVVKKRVVAA